MKQKQKDPVHFSDAGKGSTPSQMKTARQQAFLGQIHVQQHG
jgi:hypothetical protein